MLVFEKEGFLEIEDSLIEELYQSRASVTWQIAGVTDLQLRAVLCRHKTADAKVFHVAFYCRQVKRAFIYGVAPSAASATTEALLHFVQSLGFQLEPVNLNLNPALRQVILKDVGGLLSPAEAARQHAEKEATLAELNATIKKGPAESAEVKRAALKLNAERHLDNQSVLLRTALESRMPAPDNASRDIRDLTQKVATLSSQLQQALTLAEEERLQREQADTIRVAVENRLQHLEAELVVAETRTSALQKKVTQLERKLGKEEKKFFEAEAALKSALAKEKELVAASTRLQEEAQRLRSELNSSTSRITAAEKTLGSAEKQAEQEKQAAAKEIDRLKECARTLEQALKSAAAERDEIKAAHARLAKSAECANSRIGELEAALADSLQKRADLEAGEKAADLSGERRHLEAALGKARNAAHAEKTARAKAEKALQQAQSTISDLQQTVTSLQASDDDRRGADLTPRDSQGEARLRDQVRELEEQLERERQEVNSLLNALNLAMKKTIELEGRLLASDRPAPLPARQPSLEPVQQMAPPPPQPVKADAASPANRKPLPHEIRPAPKPGALFHPDWDLAGLPCHSAEQILEAWESVFNVQLALEGYPSQYCAAFVVIIKAGKMKKIFLLFELKQDKHVLVCLPGTPPRNEAALKELVGAAKNYLKLSGFEIEKIPSANLASTLAKYFVPPSSG